MNTLIVVSTSFSALATIGIFIFTLINYRMYQKIKKENKEQQQRFNDLFEGIIIATLLSGPSSYGAYRECKNRFFKEYKGKTKIFKEL